MITALDLIHFHFQYFHFDGLLWQKVAHFLSKDLDLGGSYDKSCKLL